MKFRRNLSLGVVLLAFVCAPAAAQDAGDADYAKARDYFYGRNGVTYDLKKARQYYEQAAAAGHEEAQALVGEAYLIGSNGFKRDKNQGFKWLEAAAEQGNGWAQYTLGSAYHRQTDGVKNDYTKAHEYYRAAFENPRIDSGSNIAKKYALYSLGELYENGLGRDKDMAKALVYYTRSAKLNHNSAQYKLGKFYLEGKVAPKDEETALLWLKKAALLGQYEAQELLKKKYKINVFELPKEEQDRLYAATNIKELADAAVPEPPGPLRSFSSPLPNDLDLSEKGPVAE